MTVMGATIEDLKRLPVSVRIQLVEDLWDSIAEDPQALGLTPEHIAELDRRLDALEAQPRAGTAWEVARERILASLGLCRSSRVMRQRLTSRKRHSGTSAVGLGAEFVRSVDACFAIISRQPDIFPVVYRQTRMALLRRFPYLVIYRLFPDFVSVVAVVHGRRHPRHWKTRVAE